MTLEGKVTTLEGKVRTLKGELMTLKGEVMTLKGEVTTLKGKWTTLEEEKQKHDSVLLKFETSARLAQGELPFVSKLHI
jgi:predicted nuclease with TOPRIM domain